MLRSFDYVAWSALDRIRARHGAPDQRVVARAFGWRDAARRQFLDAYWAIADAAGILPGEAARQELLDLFTIEKALYEVAYEAANRPAWLSIPVRGLIELIASRKTDA
jgi:maltose alpha-D-glucosyltransferase/alpha-amylase